MDVPTPLRPRVAAAGLIGGAAALGGVHWDDAWHTDRGRDSFFAPPHIGLYLGVGLVTLTIVWWWWDAWRSGARRPWREPALRYASLGAAATFISAPIDEAWHQLFGRDAVLWSPPHMLGAVATVVLSIGFAAGVAANRPRRRWLEAGAGALVLGGLLVPVMEYEADVPQFSLIWYLPVLTVGVLVGREVLAGIAQSRWGATTAAAALACLQLALIVVLDTAGFSHPVLVPLLPLVAILDWAESTGGRRRLAILATISPAVLYLPVHAAQPAGIRLTAGQTIVSVSLAALAVASLLVLTRSEWTPRPHLPRHGGAIAAILVLLMVLPASAAWAHDPGQGDEVASTDLQLARDGGRTRIIVDLRADDCTQYEPIRAVGRRAGRTTNGPLTRVMGCRFEGYVPTDDPGRWFVYAELRESSGGSTLETWLPIGAGVATSRDAGRSLYVAAVAPSSAAKWATGILLYALSFVVGCMAVRAATSSLRAGQREAQGRGRT